MSITRGISDFSFAFSADLPDSWEPVIWIEAARGRSENFAVDRKSVRPRPLPVRRRKGVTFEGRFFADRPETKPVFFVFPVRIRCPILSSEPPGCHGNGSGVMGGQNFGVAIFSTDWSLELW